VLWLAVGLSRQRQGVPQVHGLRYFCLGLNGYILSLLGIVSGWHQGDELAALPGPPRAQCAGRVGAKHRAHMVEELRAIFAAPEATQARAMARSCAARWRASHPAVAAQLEEELEPCLACYAVPSAHRVRVRTTNGLERLNQELKRRTRVVRIVPNRAAPAADDRLGHGAVGGIGQRTVLPGHGTAEEDVGASGNARRPGRLTTTTTSVQAFYSYSRT
jgi:hypothetical protein